MNLKTILIPPLSIPRERLFRQFLIIFDEIFLYAASEDTCRPEDFYSRQHLIRRYAPVPFAEDLENFQHLIRDISSHRDEYYGGGVFSMSKAVRVDEEAVWDLVSRIMVPENSEDKGLSTLTQARLLLRLSEIMTDEEEEINNSLRQVEQRTASMLSALQNTAAKTTTEQPPPAASETGGPAIQQLKAWIYLFMADKETDRPWTAAPASRETFELLADYYSRELDKGPRLICRLPLPDCGGDNDKYLERRNKIRQAGSQTLQGLAKELHNLTQGAPVNRSLMDKLTAEWETTMNNYKTGTASLEFYLFKDVSLPELLGRVINQTGGRPLNCSQPPHALMAVI
ncbi:hypothetical protein ACOHYD_10615 [Desulfobacterota bacterium M19]